jgi:hypothetical protein
VVVEDSQLGILASFDENAFPVDFAHVILGHGPIFEVGIAGMDFQCLLSEARCGRIHLQETQSTEYDPAIRN